MGGHPIGGRAAIKMRCEGCIDKIINEKQTSTFSVYISIGIDNTKLYIKQYNFNGILIDD